MLAHYSLLQPFNLLIVVVYAIGGNMILYMCMLPLINAYLLADNLLIKVFFLFS